MNYKRVNASTCNTGDWIWWGIDGTLYPAVVLDIDKLSGIIPILTVLCKGQVWKQTSFSAIRLK